MFRPPRPKSLPAIAALLRAIVTRDGNLLGLLPAAAYRMAVGRLGRSRRGIFIVNDPREVRRILRNEEEIFPKSDLMVSALAPLIGDSIFVSGGETWRRQRRMIDPAFSHMRLNTAFKQMVAAVDHYEGVLDGHAAREETFSLDLAMSQLTADVITRTVFSTALDSGVARDVFESFTVFERQVAQVSIRRLITDPAWSSPPQPPEVAEACRVIRARLGDLVDAHLAKGADRPDDIAGAVIQARDPETGQAFDREELIDQLGVMFLAGHETTASALTWVFFILARRPEILERARREVETVCGSDTPDFAHVRSMNFIRNVFRETLRLYPPITFLPRVATAKTRVGKCPVSRGGLLMVAPWTMHRHKKLWRDPDVFDPDRFAAGSADETATKDAYIPFGQGPRVCVGAAFAAVEATLIIARFVKRYDFEINDPDAVQPAARLTTRPATPIRSRVRRRDNGDNIN